MHIISCNLTLVTKASCLPLHQIKHKVMLRFFKIIATLEGISLLVLFGVAMPMKYIWHNETLMKPAGYIHGFLFIAYIIAAFILKESQNWPVKKFLIICLASVIPFGTFYIEYKYFKNTQNG